MISSLKHPLRESYKSGTDFQIGFPGIFQTEKKMEPMVLCRESNGTTACKE